jgi:hypothetical protein
MFLAAFVATQHDPDARADYAMLTTATPYDPSRSKNHAEAA